MKVCRAMFSFMLALIGCGPTNSRLNATIKVPTRTIEVNLQKEIELFVEDARIHGVSVSSQALDDLRVVKTVIDVPQEIAKVNYTGPSSEDDDSTAIGVCLTGWKTERVPLPRGKLVVARRTWKEVWLNDDVLNDKTQPMVRHELIYHELGHCLLGLDHAGDFPHSIMSPHLAMDEEMLASDWNHLVNSFFKK